MADPKRREQRRTHLDASVVPVERALLQRAAEIERILDGPDDRLHPIRDALVVVAAEFRDLSEELHWW